MSPDARILAEFTDYAGMLAAVRTRIEELAIAGDRFEEFAGLPRGYLSKLVGVNPQRRIAMVSMGPLFSALGVSCIMVEDPIATARLRSRLRPRNNSFARRTPLYVITTTGRQWAHIQKLGRAARWRRLSKKQRSEIMRAVRIGAKRR
jgi:hypothetical protein